MDTYIGLDAHASSLGCSGLCDILLTVQLKISCGAVIGDDRCVALTQLLHNRVRKLQTDHKTTKPVVDNAHVSARRFDFM